VRGSSESPIDLADPSIVNVIISVDDVEVWRNGAAQNATGIACEGHGVNVRVEYSHQIFMPFIPQLLGRSNLPLNAEVTDTILTPLCP
jgi:hypothetical protein